MKTGLWFAVLTCVVVAFDALAQVPTPIGKIDSLTGRVVATNPGGSQIELAQGDPVYQGYILETGEDAAVGVILADESVFSMDENGRLALDSMVYDPAEKSGSAAISMIQGVFTFVSGQIAKSAPDAMVLKTPSAEVGIRGTAMGLTVNSIGFTVVAMLEEADSDGGEALVSNDGGDQVINTPYMAVSIKSFKARPSKPFKMALQEMGIRFGGALRMLPRAKKLIHKKIRNESARQYNAIKAKKTASKTRQRMIKRFQKTRRTQNIQPTFQPGMNSSDRARQGAANRMRDAMTTMPVPKQRSSSGGGDTGQQPHAANPCAGTGGVGKYNPPVKR